MRGRLALRTRTGWKNLPRGLDDREISNEDAAKQYARFARETGSEEFAPGHEHAKLTEKTLLMASTSANTPLNAMLEQTKVSPAHSEALALQFQHQCSFCRLSSRWRVLLLEAAQLHRD